MRLTIHSMILGAAGCALVGLVGCENNEARVTGTGVTPPGAAATSEDSAKVKIEPTRTAPPGYGPAMGRRAPAPKSPAPAEEKK
jgi:hypothetical protein